MDQPSRRGDRRASLLAAARRVFATKDFPKVRIEDITSAAGLAKGTFYLYFPSLSAFSLALVDELLDELRRTLRPLTEGDLSRLLDRDEFVIALRPHLEFQRRNLALVGIFQHAAQLRPDAFSERMRAFPRDMGTFIHQAIARGIEQGVVRPVDPLVAAIAVRGLIERVFRSIAIRMYPFPADEVVLRDVHTILCHGLLEPAGAPAEHPPPPASRAPTPGPAPEATPVRDRQAPSLTRRGSRSDRSAAILLAAHRVFSEKGFARTHIEDIAAEAGLAKGTLYLDFRSKRALYLALIDELIEKLRKASRHFSSCDLPNLQDPGTFVEAVRPLLQVHRENGALIRGLHYAAFAKDDELTPLVVDLARELQEHGAAWLGSQSAACLRRGVNPAVATVARHAMCETLFHALAHRMFPFAEEDAVLRSLHGVLCHGLLARKD